MATTQPVAIDLFAGAGGFGLGFEMAGFIVPFSLDIPVVAIECKTYLDKTMLEGSSRAAEDLKARNPNSLYIVIMEWIKLTSDVNLRKYKVDQIYVLRQQKNTDREYRYEDGYVKNPIDLTVVQLCTKWLTKPSPSPFKPINP